MGGVGVGVLGASVKVRRIWRSKPASTDSGVRSRWSGNSAFQQKISSSQSRALSGIERDWTTI